MSQPPSPPGAGPPAGASPSAVTPTGVVPSVRSRLARAAAQAALEVDGVEAMSAGRLGNRFTVDEGERLPGVLVAALPDGRYQVALHLVTRLVPLLPLGDLVRSRVVQAAGEAGLADALGRVDVSVEDLFEAPAAPTAPPAEPGATV